MRPLRPLIGALVSAVFGAVVLMLASPSAATAQVNMPNPKEISGVPLPANDLPAGTISVRVVRGGFDKNLSNQVVTFAVTGAAAKTAKTGDDGRTQMTFAPGARVTASVTVDGETLTSQEILVNTASGVRIVLVATDPEAAAREAEDRKLAAGPAVAGTVALGPNTRIVIEPGDETISVFYVLAIVNSARTPVDIGGPLILQLPTGARSASIMEGSAPTAKVNGPRVNVLGPFAPGETQVQVAFELPTGGDSIKIVQRMPVPTADSTIVLARTGTEDLVSAQIRDKQETVSNGQRVVFGRGAAVEAGGTLTLTVTGLAHHSRVPRYFALAFGLGFVVVGLREGFRRA